jgi:AcrR family transcriptional regulator
MSQVKPTPRRTYGGQTADQRAAQRREELISTAFGLVAEHGWRDLTIEAVCRRAGLNKRYFYETFSNLDALIGALVNQLAGDAITVTLAAVGPTMTPREITRAAVTTFVTHLTDDPRRALVLFGAVPAADAAAGHRARAIREVITTVAAQGRSIHDLADAPIVDLTAAMLVGGTSQAVLDWLEGQFDITRAQLIDDLTALWGAISDAAAATARQRAHPDASSA